jgi:hypothetical protein
MLVVGCFPFSLQRILPDPVAFSPIFQTVFGQHNLPAVVRFIPADGIEQKLSIIRAAIMERLAADDVVRQFFDELRHERVEGFGIFAMGEAILPSISIVANRTSIALNEAARNGR